MPKYCSECRWNGHEDCVAKGYKPDSLACRNFDPPPIEWSQLAADTKIQNIMNMVKTDPKFHLNAQAILEELDNYALALDRKTMQNRIPTGSLGYQDFLTLAQLHAQNQAYRDRVSSLTMHVNRLKRALRMLWESSWAHLRVTYPYKLASVGTQSALDSIVAKLVLGPLDDKLAEVNDVLDALSTVENNLTNLHFTLKEVHQNLQAAMYSEPSRRLTPNG